MPNKHGQWFPVAQTTNEKITFLPKSLDKLITIPRLGKKPMLKVTTVYSSLVTILNYTLDLARLKCENGILCWTGKNENQTTKRTPACCLGFIPEILSSVQKDLGIDLILYEVSDRNYGATVNGIWNGLIGEVLYGRADMAVEGLTITEARQHVVDFTAPISTAETVVVTMLQYHLLPYLNLEAFAAISTYSWSLIVIFTIVVSAVIYGAENTVDLHGSKDSFMSMFMYTVGLLFQRDVGGSNPCHIGGRTIGISVAIGMMVIMTAYTAVLTARNINVAKVLPVSGFYDPKITQPTSKFRFGTTKDTSLSQGFENHTNNNWRKVGKFMQSYNHDTVHEGFISLSKGEVQAMVTEDIELKREWRQYKSCNIQKAGKAFIKQEWAFALPKGSQWNQPISALIRKYKESGLLADIEHHWLTGKCSKNEQNTINGAEQFGIRYLSGASSMLLLGFIFSLFIFVLEYLLKRRKIHSYTLPKHMN